MNSRLMPIFGNFDLNLLDDLVTGGVPAVRQSLGMKVDISEDKDKFNVVADLPGFKKEAISADFKDGVLTLSAERSSVKESTEAEKIWRSERSYGLVKRSFQFGDSVDSASVSATYVDGVLTVNLPKKQKEEASTKINIS